MAKKSPPQSQDEQDLESQFYFSYRKRRSRACRSDKTSSVSSLIL